MLRQSLYFTAPGKVEIVEEELAQPEADQVLVKTTLSAISPGTELLFYRGQFPEDMQVDESIAALQQTAAYPLKYGYALVGRVISIGTAVDPVWLDQLIFSFHPHESHFTARPTELLPIPEDISPEDAVFLPNMETAVNFAMDGAPLIGEQVVIFGQGVVGLLTTALMAQFPLNSLVTVDRYANRRQVSLNLGADSSIAPDETDLLKTLQPQGADLSFELSGSPAALDQAIRATGYAGRVVVGSWYGQKKASLDLGSRFHRSRIRLISSQVSTIAPELRGRWTQTRRINVSWDMLRRIKPSRLITDHMQLKEASIAYQLLDQQAENCIQIIFSYQPD